MNFKKEDKLAKRLWSFQTGDFNIESNKEGYGYKYAPLDSIIKTIKPLLKSNGIGYIHQITEIENSKVLQTKIFSCDNIDDYLSSDLTIEDITFKGMNKLQALGASITYLKRYQLCALLGIVSEEDTDGSSKVKQIVDNKSETTTIKQPKQDFVAIFSKYISSGQPKESILKAFKMYEPKLTKDQHEQIHKMISNYENK